MNSPSRTVVRLGLAVLLFAAGLRATAEDFEFEVPVKVSKLDATFTQGKVSCSVYGPTQIDSVGVARVPSSKEGVYGVIGSGEGAYLEGNPRRSRRREVLGEPAQRTIECAGLLLQAQPRVL